MSLCCPQILKFAGAISLCCPQLLKFAQCDFVVLSPDFKTAINTNMPTGLVVVLTLTQIQKFAHAREETIFQCEILLVQGGEYSPPRFGITLFNYMNS